MISKETYNVLQWCSVAKRFWSEPTGHIGVFGNFGNYVSEILQMRIVKPTPNAQRKLLSAARNRATLHAACRLDASQFTTPCRNPPLRVENSAPCHPSHAVHRLRAFRPFCWNVELRSVLEVYADLPLGFVTAANIGTVQSVHSIAGRLKGGQAGIASRHTGHGAKSFQSAAQP